MTTNDSEDTSRRAQDTLLLLGTALAAAGLILSAGLLPIPMLGCLGLPIAMVAALGFAVGILVCGRLEVPAWRQVAGVLLAVVGLYLFFEAWLDGLDVIAAHFLDRAGAPSLRELGGPALRLLASGASVGVAVALRRAKAFWIARAMAAVVLATGLLSWLFLIVLGLLGAPFGA